MLLLIRFFVLAASPLLAGCGGVLGKRAYHNLDNPTEYVFHVPVSRVMDALREKNGLITPPPEYLRGGLLDSGVYWFRFSNLYTKRYWTGEREKSGEVDPPEAGRIGTIDGKFGVEIIPIGETKTRVRVVVLEFKQQVGRGYRLSPHFQRVSIDKPVKSDTFFEYVFLLRLGELLKEEGMPSLKGSDAGDEYR